MSPIEVRVAAIALLAVAAAYLLVIL